MDGDKQSAKKIRWRLPSKSKNATLQNAIVPIKPMNENKIT
jgi:hypothetical protein